MTLAMAPSLALSLERQFPVVRWVLELRLGLLEAVRIPCWRFFIGWNCTNNLLGRPLSCLVTQRSVSEAAPLVHIVPMASVFVIQMKRWEASTRWRSTQKEISRLLPTTPHI